MKISLSEENLQNKVAYLRNLLIEYEELRFSDLHSVQLWLSSALQQPNLSLDMYCSLIVIRSRKMISPSVEIHYDFAVYDDGDAYAVGKALSRNKDTPMEEFRWFSENEVEATDTPIVQYFRRYRKTALNQIIKYTHPQFLFLPFSTSTIPHNRFRKYYHPNKLRTTRLLPPSDIEYQKHLAETMMPDNEEPESSNT